MAAQKRSPGALGRATGVGRVGAFGGAVLQTTIYLGSSKNASTEHRLSKESDALVR
jgi:hypothetical protein